MIKILLAFVALIVVVSISAQNWRRSVAAVLVLAVIEGALRKWALPQASQLIYFFKDFILLGAYLRFFFLEKTPRPSFPYEKLIISLASLSFIWGTFQALNPSLGSPIIGIFGLKNYFLYIPLIWLVPSFVDTEEDLYRFLRRYLLVLIPVGLLAIAQFFSPPTSPLNVYAWGEESLGIALGGDLKSVRVTGTFSYIAGYSVYLIFCLCLLLPLLSKKQPRLWQWATLIQLLLAIVTGFMTASRGVMLIFVLLLAGFLGLQSLASFSALFNNLKKLVLPMAIALGISFWKFPSAINSLWLRVSNNQDISKRITGSFTEVWSNFQYKALDGYGIGATFQANPMLRSLLGLPSGETIPVYFESEMGRIALEIGPLGFLLWYGFKLVLLVLLWITYYKLKRPFLKQLALSAFLLQAITFNGQLVYNHTANLYQWFLYSFIFLLPHLEKVYLWQAYSQQQARYDQASYLSSTPHQ